VVFGKTEIARRMVDLQAPRMASASLYSGDLGEP